MFRYVLDDGTLGLFVLALLSELQVFNEEYPEGGPVDLHTLVVNHNGYFRIICATFSRRSCKLSHPSQSPDPKCAEEGRKAGQIVRQYGVP